MKTPITSALLIIASQTTTFAQDYSNVTSGMLLGVYCQPCGHGMKISSLIPGYTAEGRLYPGDVIKRATVDGNTIYSTRSHYELENAKRAIGPNRDAALEIYRPNQGLIYVWVQFTPLYGPAAAAAPAGTKAYGARYKTEKEKPGARNLFRKKSGGSRKPGNFRKPGFSSGRPSQSTSQSSNGAARLFGK